MNQVVPYAALAAQQSAPVTHWGARLFWTGVTAVVIVGLYLLMWRSWRRRAARQADLPPLAPLGGSGSDGADEEHALLSGFVGRYYGTTTAGEWLDRINAQSLGVRSAVRLTLTSAGLDVERGGAHSFRIPAAALRGAGRGQGIAGKVTPSGGLLIVTWQHGERLLDSGFRSEHPAEHGRWIEELSALLASAPPTPTPIPAGRDGEGTSRHPASTSPEGSRL